MIIGIGIDSVEVERFLDWHKKSHDSLARIFSDNEIEYCLSNKKKSAQRFAARFAAKEAVTKALHAAFTHHSFSLLHIAKNVHVAKNALGVPQLSINWQHILPTNFSNLDITSHISLTHTDTFASAFVILEK